MWLVRGEDPSADRRRRREEAQVDPSSMERSEKIGTDHLYLDDGDLSRAEWRELPGRVPADLLGPGASQHDQDHEPDTATLEPGTGLRWRRDGSSLRLG